MYAYLQLYYCIYNIIYINTIYSNQITPVSSILCKLVSPVFSVIFLTFMLWFLTLLYENATKTPPTLTLTLTGLSRGSGFVQVVTKGPFTETIICLGL